MSKTESKVHLRVSIEEEAAWRAHAEQEGKSLSAWIRDMLNERVTVQPKPVITPAQVLGTLVLMPPPPAHPTFIDPPAPIGPRVPTGKLFGR